MKTLTLYLEGFTRSNMSPVDEYCDLQINRIVSICGSPKFQWLNSSSALGNFELFIERCEFNITFISLCVDGHERKFQRNKIIMQT